MAEQARKLLKGGVDYQPLIKGPYVSVSRSFKWGRNLKDLAADGLVHPALPGLAEYPQMFEHQDKALREIKNGNHCLISTGTGSGKTESFLYPILDYCLELRDNKAPAGIVAILVYPMNALALDQLSRLRRMLVGSGITFGMYIGTTAASTGDVHNIHRMESGEGRIEYGKLKEKYKNHELMQISPPEERLTEEEIAQIPPRILLTNVKQLELLTTRKKDVKIFLNAPLKYLVFDEIHTYSGVAGAEVSCLVRRLRGLSEKSADDVICIGTSATITDPELGEEAGKQFAQRFFGVNKDRISLIGEEYESEEFPLNRYKPALPHFNTLDLFNDLLEALEGEDEEKIKGLFKDLTGNKILDSGNIYESLYESLKQNEYVYSLFSFLSKPEYLKEAVQKILTSLARKDKSSSQNNQAELLCYLALGAAASKGDNPLIKPKLHYFAKGLEGAVVAFSSELSNGELNAVLFLSKRNAINRFGYDEHAYLPVYVCKTCGQHYYEAYFNNCFFDGNSVTGGQAENTNVIWAVSNETNGNRVILTDNFVAENDDDEQIGIRLDRRREEVYFCRHCGTLQKDREDECANPKCKRVNTIVKLFIVLINNDGLMTSCPSCGARGQTFGRNNEPIRPLRASTVSDVHIISQNMINATKGANQKLIVFADNRQDAAFQAGWMQDHARRYRFRHLIYEYLKQQDRLCSISDIQDHLYQTFFQDKSIGTVLAPEVYENYRPEVYGNTFHQQLKYFLRFQILRELGTSFTQKEGLEPWGILSIVYNKIDEENKFIKKWAEILNVTVTDLVDGIASILDVFRRNRYVYDNQTAIYTKVWNEGDFEVQNGYVPLIKTAENRFIPPKGIAERRVEDSNYKYYFRSNRSQSLTEKYFGKWINENETKDTFLNDLWDFLVNDSKIFTPVEIVGRNNRVLASGIYQIDSTKIGLAAQLKLYQCSICHRIHQRNSPSNVCTSMHCRGRLELKEPSEENYNISLLKSSFSMIKPQEHTAQVPAKKREEIENEFKKAEGKYNTLVATPTLELGVDIGDLDMVLMRNVPPTSSNYWQRAGRAGRRHRLAVIYSYTRRSEHDKYFFEEPKLMLDGIISTPKFNLRNEIMLKKHIHSAILSEMLRLILNNKMVADFDETQKEELKSILEETFPTFIKSYLYDDENRYMDKPFNINSFDRFIKNHAEYFLTVIKRIFIQYWNEEDLLVLGENEIKRVIHETPVELGKVLNLLHLRMMWAVNTRRKFAQYQQQRLLEPEEEKILKRCDSYLKELYTVNQTNYTLNVLANEGFLPGYGLYDTGIKAFVHQSFIGDSRNKPDFVLSRAPMIAVREYVPGNMIYANNGKFKLVLYRFTSLNDGSKEQEFNINIERRTLNLRESVDQKHEYSDSSNQSLVGIPISDSDLHYVSRISDEEVNRFQLPVTILGKLKRYRRGGKFYTVGSQNVKLLFGQRLLLVNIGPNERVDRNLIGYPICKICGAVRSPLSSEAEIDHFKKFHKERCGKEPLNICITAEDDVDGILIENIIDQRAAANIGESIIIGASQQLEMERNDLSTIIYNNNDNTCSLLIFDPMPGGSGLLNQIMDNWRIIIAMAVKSLNNCSNNCDTSCYDCMRTYHNVFNHSLLDRKYAHDIMQDLLYEAEFESDIPPLDEVSKEEHKNKGTNKGEIKLPEILSKYGFPDFDSQKRIDIGPPYNSTTPDLYYQDEVQDIYLCIYFDGLSKNIHGNEERRKIDIIIRNILESRGYDVIEIASSDLNDPEALKMSLKRIAVRLKVKDLKF